MYIHVLAWIQDACFVGICEAVLLSIDGSHSYLSPC